MATPLSPWSSPGKSQRQRWNDIQHLALVNVSMKFHSVWSFLSLSSPVTSRSNPRRVCSRAQATSSGLSTRLTSFVRIARRIRLPIHNDINARPGRVKRCVVRMDLCSVLLNDRPNTACFSSNSSAISANQDSEQASTVLTPITSMRSG
jgi:hypothetical protein